MSTTLTYGMKVPDTGDRGSTFFPDLEDNFTQLDAHSHNGVNSPKIAASNVTNSASGNLAATNVQAALEELQTDIDTRITASSSSTLTNKKLSDSTCTIVDDGDNTKQIAFQASGITTGTTRTITMPDANVNLGALTNSNIDASAGIAVSKLAAVTASRALESDASGFVSASAVTSTELGYVSGVTSAIQTQINAKAPSASPTFSGTITTPLTASRALVTGASSELSASAVTATELGYLSGATSSIQNQLNAITGGASSADDLLNYELSCSVAGNALTIALKDGSGSDPSGGSPVKVSFRSTTAGTGTYDVVSATAATSLVISSGSTLGHTSAKDEHIYVYAANDGGTLVLAASTKLFDDAFVASSTAEGGAGAADSATTLYSTAAFTDKAIRLIGVLMSNQVTAGTWASAPAHVSLRRTVRYTLGSRQIFTTPGANTWTRPAGCKAVNVIVVAGGGGSGGANSAAAEGSVGGSGGGGGASIKFITTGLGATETVTVGDGGTAGASSGTAGGTGGTSSFGSHCSATGGEGGDVQASGTTAVRGGTPGSGGVGSGGDLNIKGGIGSYGWRESASAFMPSNGGSSILGGGSQGASGNVGTAGGTYGGGAGGSSSTNNTDRAGAAGGQGIVIVDEYY